MYMSSARQRAIGSGKPPAHDARMDGYDASKHAAEVLKGSDAPIWKYRSGRLTQLVNWCTEQARDEAVRTGCSAETLDDYLHAGLDFARDFHEALNPVGARMLTEGPPSLEEGGDRKPHFQWLRTTGTVWNHDDPADHLQGWRDAVAHKQIVSFPAGCNLELVAGALDAYLKLPHLHHSWLEWCMFDALVRAEAIGVADQAYMLTYDILAPYHSRRGRLERAIFARADRRRAEGAAKEAAPYVAVFTAMLDVYRGLAGDGWTISPTRVRETIVAVGRIGGRWAPPCWVLIDRAMQRDPSTWNYEPP